MTDEQQRQYWRKYARQNAKMERLAYYLMLWTFRDGFSNVINSITTVGIIETLASMEQLISRSMINAAYGKIYAQVGEKQKVWADRDILIRLVRPRAVLSNVPAPPLQAEFGVGFYNAQWLARLRNISNNIDTIERVASVHSTICKDMRRSIANAQQEVVSTRKVIARLRRDFPELSARRAEVIARTEVTYISNIAQEEAAMETGLDLMKVWIRTLDTRTRDTHRNAPRKPIKADEKFVVGGKKMTKPGDPAGGMAEICNCRCVVSYLPADDFEDLLDEQGDFQREPVTVN